MASNADTGYDTSSIASASSSSQITKVGHTYSGAHMVNYDCSTKLLNIIDAINNIIGNYLNK